MAERDEQFERDIRTAQLSPAEQATLRYMQNSRDLSRGVERLGAAAAGVTLPEDAKRKAMAEVQDLARTVQPGTKEFFEKAAAIFQKYGLADMAAQMTAKAREAELADVKLAGERFKGDDLETMRRKREHFVNIGAPQQFLDAVDREIAQVGTYKPPAEKNPDKNVQYDQQATVLEEAAAKATDPAVKQKLQDRAAALRALIKPTGGKEGGAASERGKLQSDIAHWKQVAADPKTPPAERAAAAQRAADLEKAFQTDERAQNLPREKEETKTADAKKAAGEALAAAYARMAEKLEVAQMLVDHSGLPDILGFFQGRVDGASLSPEKAGDALAMYDFLVANTFIDSLNRLRKAAAGDGGRGTGLGQLTEREGEAIRAAESLLSRRTGSVDQYKGVLDQYIAKLQQGMQAAQVSLQQDFKLPVPQVPSIAATIGARRGKALSAHTGRPDGSGKKMQKKEPSKAPRKLKLIREE